MKQYITLGEMKRDLSPDNYKIDYLLKWLNKKYPEQLDHITIGQMIEFLGNDIDSINKEHKNGWSAVVDIDGDWKTFYDEESLCDCLWEAIKEVLNGRAVEA